MVLLTIHVISEGREGTSSQTLLLQCFFLLAAISKISDLFMVTPLIYLVSSGMMLFSSFQPSWEMNLFSPPLLIFISCWIWETSSLFNPNHCTPFFSLHTSKMRKVFLLASEVFQWLLGWQAPVQKSIPGSLFWRPLVSVMLPNPCILFKLSMIKWNSLA